MIEMMTGMPDGTLGFRVAGNVTRDDLAKVVVPMLREVIERNQPLRVLCQIDAGFSEELGAVWEGVKATLDTANTALDAGSYGCLCTFQPAHTGSHGCLCTFQRGGSLCGPSSERITA
jgi:hypothetical protein